MSDLVSRWDILIVLGLYLGCVGARLVKRLRQQRMEPTRFDQMRALFPTVDTRKQRYPTADGRWSATVNRDAGVKW